MKIVIRVKCWGFRYVLAYWQTGINSCNWAQQPRLEIGGIFVQWKQSFVSVSPSLLPKFLQSSIYTVPNLDLSLINCCSKFFKTILLSQSEMGSKREIIGLQNTFLTHFLTIFLMDDVHSFSGSSYRFTHSMILLL